VAGVSDRWRRLGFLVRYLAGAVVIAAIGSIAGVILLADANNNDAWAEDARGGDCAVEDVDSPEGTVTVGGLPTQISTSFGYGRGRRVLENTTLSATPDENVALPERIGLRLLPLGSDNGPSIADVGAVATQVGDTSSYTLAICIDGDGVRAGTYQASLLFTDPDIRFENTPVVQATFQNRLVPFMLLTFLPLAAPAGVFYMALMLIRRAKPDFAPFTDTGLIKGAFGSWNGVVAILAAATAAFGTWHATCFLEPTWGASWPDIIKSGGAIAAAGATAASLPLGFSSKSVEEQEEEEQQQDAGAGAGAGGPTPPVPAGGGQPAPPASPAPPAGGQPG
jgi:hypothetical protein